MKEILYEADGKVGIITINRPTKANAANIEMLQKMHSYLIEADKDEKIKCIIIRSTGERFFSAGYDLKEVAGDPENVKLITKWGRKVNETILFLFTNRKVGLEELKNINFPTKIVPYNNLEEATLDYAKALSKLKMEFLFTAKSMMTIMNKSYITSCLDLEDECGAYAYGPKKSMKELHNFIKELYEKYP